MKLRVFGENYMEHPDTEKGDSYAQRVGSDSRLQSQSSTEGLTELKLGAYLRDAIYWGDTNHDGTLSRKEFDAFRKRDWNKSHEQAADFVDKHFGTISILSTDSVFNEGGISRNDIDALGGNVLAGARESYQKKYSEPTSEIAAGAGVLAGIGAQGADLAFTGGALTAASFLGTTGFAIYGTFGEHAKLPALGILTVSTASLMWGPLAGGAGGYYLGQAIGDQMAGSRFDRKYKPEIESMLKDLR